MLSVAGNFVAKSAQVIENYVGNNFCGARREFFESKIFVNRVFCTQMVQSGSDY
jgi:hypothetical protein